MLTTNMEIVQAAVLLVGLFAAIHVLSIALGFVRLVVKWTLVVLLVSVAVALVLDIPFPSSSSLSSSQRHSSSTNTLLGKLTSTFTNHHHKTPITPHSTPSLDTLTDMLEQSFTWAQSSVMQAIKNEPLFSFSSEKSSDSSDSTFFRSILPDRFLKSTTVKAKPAKLKKRH